MSNEELKNDEAEVAQTAAAVPPAEEAETEKPTEEASAQAESEDAVSENADAIPWSPSQLPRKSPKK